MLIWKNKRTLIYISSLLVATTFMGCQANQNLTNLKTNEVDTPSNISSEPQEPATFESVLAGIDNKNWMYLTAEQRLADFDFLYEQLKENYPFFGVAKRKMNVDIHQSYQQTRKMIEECDNDDDFYALLRDFCQQIRVGHLASWGYSYNYRMEEYPKFIAEYPEYAEQTERYLKILDNPVSRANYKKMEEFYNSINEKVAILNGDAPQNNMVQNEDESVEAFDNVVTKIIEPNKIAYVEIKMFDMNVFDKSKQVLFDFYKQVADYDHLIIDISNNGGGGMSYFNELICAPNIDKPLTVPTYILLKNGGNNNRHLNLDKEIQEGLWKPVSSFPHLERMNADDLLELDYFQEDNITIDPSETEKMFKGRIWLLVSGSVYSSSEHAAMFSKQSGFATLVGTNTGGDGIGTDPVHIILPNSGLVIQHSPIYGTTADGANSEEFGTIPDVVSKDGQTPLETCLKTIANLD